MQSAKALSSIEFKKYGKTILFNLLHPLKHSVDIFSSIGGNKTSEREEHLEKILEPNDKSFAQDKNETPLSVFAAVKAVDEIEVVVFGKTAKGIPGGQIRSSSLE